MFVLKSETFYVMSEELYSVFFSTLHVALELFPQKRCFTQLLKYKSL